MTLSPETTFELLWNELGGPPLEKQYRFLEHRRFRADFAIPGKVAIEIQGGGWVQGRHHRPAGYRADCLRLNLLQMLGYRVFYFTPDMLTPEHVQPVIDFVKGKVRA